MQVSAIGLATVYKTLLVQSDFRLLGCEKRCNKGLWSNMLAWCIPEAMCLMAMSRYFQGPATFLIVMRWATRLKVAIDVMKRARL